MEEDDFLREKGLAALRLVLKKEQNIQIIENAVYKYGKNYILNIYETINYIKTGEKLNNLLSNTKLNKIDWKFPFLDDLILEENQQDEFIINPFEVEEGVQECKCGSKRVYSYQVQKRSADEPMSTFSTCMACGKKWVYSG